MQRAVTTLVGLAVVVLAVWLVVRDFQPPKAVGRDPNAASATVDGGSAEERAPMFALGDAGAAPPDGGMFLLSDLVQPEYDRRVDAGAATLLDGTPVPALPATAPREVRFGVVFVSYAGAQPSVAGGRTSTRSRADAKALAEKLVVTAHDDFHAAVQQGDGGSADDLGRVKLGVLEPAPEYVLFTLGVGAIGGPVDTPRGYWIVKRLE
jgi:PPIC-type PPIASE domain